jgi:ribonuclease BN (tRNA processing enzyme)
VGEACDPQYPNTSLLLRTETGRGHVLLDCGFTTPHRYFKECTEAEDLQALWISHFHGDHFFGVPLLLLRFWEMGRRDSLTLIGPAGIERKVSAAMDLAYPNCRARLSFPVVFQEVSTSRPLTVAGLGWRAAASEHSGPALAVCVTDGKKTLFYSGDGRATPGTLALAQGCDLIVHEAFRLTEETPGHGSILGSLSFAREAGVRNLALLHVNRDDRGKHLEAIRMLINQATDLNVLLPEPGDSIIL